MSLDQLRQVKKSKGKGVYSFYEQQNEIIDSLLSPVKNGDEDDDTERLKVKIAVYGSFCANLSLFGLQLYAAISSHSLSILATMAESFMDVLSSAVLVYAARAIANSNLLKYPVGKARLETVGVIIFSALMGTLSLGLMIEGIRALISHDHSPELKTGGIICIAIALAVKSVLFIYCRALKDSPSAQACAQDHQNDVLVNTFGLIAAILGTRIAWWVDAAGALSIALLIMKSWTTTAYENIELLVGKSADPNFLKKITYIALTHHPKVLQVDTCRAYYAGSNMFVEVDIVMAPDTLLIESHEIGESLQTKLESLPEVERAFVHVDHESDHSPEHQKAL
ncbi:cation efflux protein [Basidiobolus meristosporus CBS 931.73]|uniref:Cation efflux protein n=1 Tax=Basidiobolus meristosporus CBS 931.73 TaxID=1314790 RepID=A0A1Y1YIW4_9FUNG|nr:cation efflux protein [Basidiobolus meristosporus CBS 931.73]|eukprot:ORX97898.1 cation efflux protein [Basidiobolus meristosporus CBS 931.73]